MITERYDLNKVDIKYKKIVRKCEEKDLKMRKYF
jgi:hypothetical protein